MIDIERDEEVAVLKLNQSVTNPLNLEFIQQMREKVKDLKGDESVKSLVIVSENDKFFSIGFDIPKLYPQDIDGIRTFYTTFNKLSLDLYTLPKPTIAAITGHAIAGGCILTLCCDYRFIAEGKRLMGLNEVKLGLPVPYPADCVLRDLVGSRTAREIMEVGDFYPPEKSLEMGMVDSVLPLEQVLPEAVKKAKILGKMPPGAYEIIKYNRVESVEAQILYGLDERESFFLDRWFSDETKELLKEAEKKF